MLWKLSLKVRSDGVLVPKTRAPPQDCWVAVLSCWTEMLQFSQSWLWQCCVGRKKGLTWEEMDHLGLYRVQAGSVTFLGTLCADSFGFWKRRLRNLATNSSWDPPADRSLSGKTHTSMYQKSRGKPAVLAASWHHVGNSAYYSLS